MIIVGELINASRKMIQQAITDRDKAVLEQVAVEQAEKGADFIDVNAGVFVDEEVELLRWLVELVQGTVDRPCCLDSPNPEAIENALQVHQGTAMINSISMEKARHERLMPVIAGTDLKVVALCMSDQGMPETMDQRLTVADLLINSLIKNNVKVENIFVDPLVQPISANAAFGVEFLKSVAAITERFPGIHIMCGLSNISYGLPQRAILNRTFLAMAVAAGMDGAIVNPLDDKLMTTITTAESLVDRDAFCLNYIKAHRAGKLSG